MYKWFICLRYLAKKRITWFSVGSVTLGVLALVVVMSVMHGFTGLLRDSMHGTLGDIVIQAWSSKGFEGYERLMEEVEGLPHVVATSPRVEKVAICTQKVGDELVYDPVRFIGIIPTLEDKVNGFRSRVGRPLDMEGNLGADTDTDTTQAGDTEDWTGKNYDFTWDDPESISEDDKRYDLCIPGSQILGGRLPASFHVGRTKVKLVTVESMQGDPSARYFIVGNTFSSGMWEYDKSTVYIPLGAAQTLARTPGAATHLLVRVDDAKHVDETVERINELIADADYLDVLYPPEALPWQKVNPSLLNAIDLETSTMYILLFLLLIVAGFATISILQMIVLQKRRDVGVLMAMGADRAGIRRVFLTFGLIIGLVGATLGVAAGMGFLWRLEDVRGVVRRATGFDPFPATLYYFTEIPKEYDAARYLRIWLAAVAVCLIAAVYPAARASRLNPVEIIRYE